MSGDVSRLIGLRLSPPDLINYCLVNKETLKNVCNSREFWIKKLSIDYPEALLPFLKHNLKLQNPKNTYIRKFTEISKKLEEISTKEGIPYNTLYRVYEEMLESYINNYKDFKLDTIKIFDKYKIKGNNIFDKYYIRGLGLLIGKRAKELSDAKEAMSLMK